MEPMRYGIEVEGRFKGHWTLILPNSGMHSPEYVEKALGENLGPLPAPDHLWLEVQPGESFDWQMVARLMVRYLVTVQIRTPADAPPSRLLRWPERFSIVWMVPDEFQEILRAAHYIKHATAPGYGFESPLTHHVFVPQAYKRDHVWPASE